MEKYISVFISVLALCSVFVEVSKIKFNPWRMLFDVIGRALNRDVKKQLSDIKHMLNAHSDYLKEIEMLVDMNEVKRIRAEILAFADSCKMGERHTEDAFLHIIDIHDDYEMLIDKYDMSNGRLNMEYEYIMDTYRNLVKKGIL